MSGRRAIRQLVATTVAAALALGSPTLIGGCSFMAVQPARKDDRGRLEPAGCTTRMTAPIVDAIITGGTAIWTLTALDSGETFNGGPLSSHDAVMLGAVSLTLFSISTLYGLVTVSNCRTANGIGTTPKKTSKERQAEEVVEEAAVQARLKAQSAAGANAAGDTAANADAGAPVTAPNH